MTSTKHFAGINHISKINIDQNAFLHEPDTNTAKTNSTGIGFDFNSNNSYQSFSTTQTFAALTNVNSFAHTSNNPIQFNEVNNYSMNLATFQHQVDYKEDDDEEEEEVVKKIVVNTVLAVVETKKRGRGRPPLTQDQKR